MLKKYLIKQNEDLKALLESGQGHTITNCTIDMGDNEGGLMIAEAVKEGMKALQAITAQNKYGIYLK